VRTAPPQHKDKTMTNQAKNITENPRIATRIDTLHGIPRLTVAVWDDAARNYVCHFRDYPADSSRFEQLEALRALVVETLYYDAKFDGDLSGYYVGTLAKLDALLDEEMAVSLARDGGAV
jgi:hypothetical protein